MTIVWVNPFPSFPLCWKENVRDRRVSSLQTFLGRRVSPDRWEREKDKERRQTLMIGGV